MKNNYNKGMIKLFFFCKDNSKKIVVTWRGGFVAKKSGG